jgi:serine phosphatase RsbU (regulator of sigma subunit)
MRSLFQSRVPEPPPTIDPVRTQFPDIPGAEMAAFFSGQRVAGDFYDAVRVSPQRILFALLDVAGRRQDNRGILTSAQKILRTLGADLFSHPDINDSETMTELCHLLNRGIMDAASGVRSCPAFIGCYHQETGTLCYSNAGHTPGLLRDHTGIVELPSTGLPLGLFSHATCLSPTVGLGKGSILVLVSRGVVDAGEKHGNVDDLPLGLERVKQRLARASSHDAREICVSILGDFPSESAAENDRTTLAFLRQS